ncbi:MAG: acetate--CoA ligase family protein, partial [Cyanobacteria bacterium]|nr:acetate--CoA ligase family protein [Cyanobacteriota bacterium]
MFIHSGVLSRIQAQEKHLGQGEKNVPDKGFLVHPFLDQKTLSFQGAQAMKSLISHQVHFGTSTPIPPLVEGSPLNMAGMNALMKPRSIALVGASEDPKAVGNAVLKNLVSGGFPGEIYLVNPKYRGQLSQASTDTRPIRYVGSVEELPAGTVDMALIMTPSRTVPGIINQLGTHGAKAAVLISAGFKETGPEGVVLENQLKEAVDRHQMVLVGPNCVGIANPSAEVGMNATFVQGTPLSGTGALVSQSGAVGIDIMNRARRVGLGVSQFVSIGNSLQVDAAKMMTYWKNDPSVKFVMGYLESIPDPMAFRKIAQEVSKEKPVLMIKAGRSSAGAKAASSHTGALAGSDNAVEALFAQSGIQRMDSIQELFAAAQAFENTKPSVGNRVGVYSNAGGYAVMATDVMEMQKKGLQVAQLTSDTEERLKNFLPAAASRKNPVDTTATVPADSPEKYKAALKAIVEDPNVDSCIVAIVPLMGIKGIDIARAVSELQQTSPKPIVAMISTGEDDLESIQKQLKSDNLPPISLYSSMEDSITGLSALEKHRLWKQKPVGAVTTFEDVQPDVVRGIFAKAKLEGRKLLTTVESLDILKAYGIKVPGYALVKTLDEAKQQAQTLGYPLVIKLNSKTISHKTEVGGVILDIRTPEQLEKAFRELQQNLQKNNVAPFAEGEGVLVQQFLTKGREVIMGINDDPQFGKMMMLGLGGIYVEVFKDVQFRLNPVTLPEVKDMMEGLKSNKILKGYRGKPGADLDTVSEVMLRLSQLVSDFPEVVELDINP